MLNTRRKMVIFLDRNIIFRWYIMLVTKNGHRNCEKMQNDSIVAFLSWWWCLLWICFERLKCITSRCLNISISPNLHDLWYATSSLACCFVSLRVAFFVQNVTSLVGGFYQTMRAKGIEETTSKQIDIWWKSSNILGWIN